jgi:hypothetical protein
MSTSIEDELALELKLKASGIEVFRDERNLFSDLPDGSQLPAYPSTAQMIKKLSAFYPKLWAQLAAVRQIREQVSLVAEHFDPARLQLQLERQLVFDGRRHAPSSFLLR